MHTLPSAREIQSISPSLGEACARLSMDWGGGGVKTKWEGEEFRTAEKAELEGEGQSLRLAVTHPLPESPFRRTSSLTPANPFHMPVPSKPELASCAKVSLPLLGLLP